MCSVCSLQTLTVVEGFSQQLGYRNYGRKPRII
jgi:hypothetical protein